MAVERLVLTPSGQVRYALKTPYRDGATHTHTHRAGTAGSDGKPCRAGAAAADALDVIPWGIRASRQAAGRGDAGASGCGAQADPTDPDKPAAPHHVAMTWAQRLKRVFGIEIDTCTGCGGPLKVIASIEQPEVIVKILARLEKAWPDNPQTQIELPFGARAPQTQARLIRHRSEDSSSAAATAGGGLKPVRAGTGCKAEERRAVGGWWSPW